MGASKNQIWNLIFISNQPIPHLSCKFDHFWEKKKFDFNICNMHTHACKTLKPGLVKYAVDANLFRLRSTNPKTNSQPLDGFWWEVLLSNRIGRGWDIFLVFKEFCLEEVCPSPRKNFCMYAPAGIRSSSMGVRSGRQSNIIDLSSDLSSCQRDIDTIVYVASYWRL